MTYKESTYEWWAFIKGKPQNSADIIVWSRCTQQVQEGGLKKAKAMIWKQQEAARFFNIVI